MYTGTLIRDLMATVERAELTSQDVHFVDTRELERIFKLESRVVENEPTLVGAA
jgi:hypothetical protein